MKKSIYLLILLSTINSFSQNKTPFWTVSDTLHKPRRNSLIVAETVMAAGSLIALNQLWYSEYPRSSFQFTNDNNQW